MELPLLSASSGCFSEPQLSWSIGFLQARRGGCRHALLGVQPVCASPRGSGSVQKWLSCKLGML